MIRTRVLVLLAAAFVLLSIASPAKPQSPLPKPTGYVNDYAGVVDAAAKERLETMLGNLDRQQQIQFSVVTVDTTGGQDIFDYSLAVARGWGIGAKDTQKPSLLLLVAIKDRKYFTQVSRHLEGDLPDGLAGQIQREQLVPAFKAKKYGQGLADTVVTYIATIAQKQGFSTEQIFPAGTAPKTLKSPGKTSVGSFVFGIFVLAIIVIFIAAALGRGGRGGSGGGGWLSWLVIGALMNSGRGSGSSGWGGGGFGGGGSSGGSSGGGFGGFGGGGDFGGGGAGGSW